MLYFSSAIVIIRIHQHLLVVCCLASISCLKLPPSGGVTSRWRPLILIKWVVQGVVDGFWYSPQQEKSRVATVLGKAFVQFPRLITWCSFSLWLIRGNVLHLQIHYNISNDKSIFKLLSICKLPCSHFYLFLHPRDECVDWSLFRLVLSKISCSLTIKLHFLINPKVREIVQTLHQCRRCFTPFCCGEYQIDVTSISLHHMWSHRPLRSCTINVS